MKNIIVILSVVYLVLLGGHHPNRVTSPPNIINVFAGNDRTICNGQSLNISHLNANISGDVSDGDWISFGDGRFQPGNLMTVRFSAAQSGQISYHPGPNDLILGFYRLMLLSDPPLNNPSERVSDEVRITFQHAPPLFCASNINVSLDERCQQKVTAQMVSPNAVPPYNNYIITLYDDKNTVIPNNILDARHLDMAITYKLGHQCTTNICWGTLRVEDYFPPQFECRNDTLSCTHSVVPDSVGFPIPAGAVIDTFANGKYWVSNWDYCSLVELSYTETTQKAECARDEDRTITRRWTAADAKGNKSQCVQNIVVKRIGLSTVTFPPHFNDVDRPAFNCSDTFPQWANGYPSPDTTGLPSVVGCGHLQATMTDVHFDLCGAGYKLARSWFVIDWCSTMSLTRNQIIEVKDKRAPIMTCQDSLFLSADAYQCFTASAPIPALLSIEDCSDYQLSYQLRHISGQEVFYVHSSGYFQNIPVGEYRLEYKATDVCGNSATCESYVSVRDVTTPFPACKAFVKVALGINGIGRVFADSYDNNSIDNCGIEKIEARKMADACGAVQPEFRDYLDFCCVEIGTSVSVEVRVTDIYGNSNTCMVETLVEDKLPPTITCPPHITLSCTDSYNINDLSQFGKVVSQESDRQTIHIQNDFHQGVVGRDGLASDNCSVQITERVEEDIDCYVGTIRRVFVVTDASGRKDSCTQILSIVNNDPFNEQDILWPSHYFGEGCRIDQLPPETTGSPEYLRRDCAQLASTYTDQLFFSQDSACLKIIREWFVVDWCQFDENRFTGRWGPYYQTIKVHNRVAPQISSSCQDTTFCSYDTACRKGWVELNISATDDCSLPSDLSYRYDVDLESNGSIDTFGFTNDFAGDLPLGTHTITWTVSDPCGNFSTCRYSFSVVDCKKPTPYCLSSLTINIDAITQDAEVEAIDFDNGSQDNCADVSQLIFTFDEAIPVKDSIDKIHYFKGKSLLATWDDYNLGVAQKWIPSKRSSAQRMTCDAIPDGVEQAISMRMTVIAPNGLYDYCDVELILQDPNNVCPDLKSSLRIAGEISTFNGQIPEDVFIYTRTEELDFETYLDKTTGTYTFDELPLDKSFSVQPQSNADPLNGLSTLDIVLTQRHLLDLVPFTSPYQFIAADVNDSGSLTASDLVVMRRMILGIINEFPKNLPSWLFVPEKEGFSHPDNPFSYITEWETDRLNEDRNDVNFVGIKVGDVNFSYKSLKDDEITSRSSITPQFRLSIEPVEGQNDLVVRANRDLLIDGWQMFLDVPGLKSAQIHSTLDTKGHIDLYTDKDILHSIKYYDETKMYKKEAVMARFSLEGEVSLQTIKTRVFRKSELYSQGEIQPLNLKVQENIHADIRLKSNPVSDFLRIEINGDKPSDYDYHIYSSEGYLLQSGKILAQHFQEELTIELSQSCLPGICYIQLQNEDTTQILKFIVIK